MTIPSLQQERDQILHQIAHIDCLIRGHVSQQTFKPKRSSAPAPYGPYFSLQRHEQGTNHCQRIGAQELEFITEAVQGYARFQELTRRYAQLTEQLTWDRQSAQIKKKFRRFSRPISPKPSTA